MKMRSTGMTRVAISGLVVLSFIAAGCVAAGAVTTGHTATPRSQNATAAGISAQLRAALAKDYKGTFGAFPKSGPKPRKGANVWIISLNEGSPGVHIATQNIVAASKFLGWRTRVVDTKGLPNAATAGIKQAIAAKATSSSLTSSSAASWRPR